MKLFVFTLVVVAAVMDSAILTLGLLCVGGFYGLLKACEAMAENNFKF